MTSQKFYVIRCSDKETGEFRGYHTGTYASGAKRITEAKVYPQPGNVKRALAYHKRSFDRFKVDVVEFIATEVGTVETPQ